MAVEGMNEERIVRGKGGVRGEEKGKVGGTRADVCVQRVRLQE